MASRDVERTYSERIRDCAIRWASDLTTVLQPSTS
jgi:hypothetical protein